MLLWLLLLLLSFCSIRLCFTIYVPISRVCLVSLYARVSTNQPQLNFKQQKLFVYEFNWARALHNDSSYNTKCNTVVCHSHKWQRNANIRFHCDAMFAQATNPKIHLHYYYCRLFGPHGIGTCIILKLFWMIEQLNENFYRICRTDRRI